MKLWGGRFEKETDPSVETFSTSIHQDHSLWQSDIEASIAHANMLGTKNIIPQQDAQQLVKGLKELFTEIESGKLPIDFKAEDIHSFIEVELSKKLGDVARKLHTARSRNDQVATDLRLFMANKTKELISEIKSLQNEFLKQAEAHKETILPGMTHFQHAQPVSLAHHLLAYFWMLQRDANRLQDSLKRVLSLPLGSAALAGTGFPIDREQVQKELEFESICENSLDAVSDRDFVVEFLSASSLVLMHLSRFAEELIIWSTPEFGFVELGDEVTTGSSIMPQKKNPDVAELIRGKVGRVYGSLMGALTMMKGLPLAYNRDLQEDKYYVMEALPTVLDCVQMTKLMLQKADWKKERMAATLKQDFSNSTDLADDLVIKGLSFRQAHEIVGRIVRYCIEHGKGVEDLTLKELQEFHSSFDEKSLKKVTHQEVLKARTSRGGTSPEAVAYQIEKAKAALQGQK